MSASWCSNEHRSIPPRDKAMMTHQVRLLVTTVVFLGILPSAACPQDFAYGLRAGPSLSRFVGEREPDWVFRVGYLAGVFGRLQLSDALAIQPQLLVHQRGASDRHYGGTKVSVTYLELPALARLKLYGGGENAVNIAVYAGPAASALLSCRYAQEEPDRWSPEPPGVLVPCAARDPGGLDIGVGFVNTRDVMVDALGGIEFVISLGSATSLSLDARYQRSLLTIDRLGIPEVWTETLAFSLAISRTRL